MVMCFKHKDIHKLSWKSPDGRTLSQLDHILINSKWRRSLNDVRVRRRSAAIIYKKIRVREWTPVDRQCIRREGVLEFGIPDWFAGPP